MPTVRSELLKSSNMLRRLQIIVMRNYRITSSTCLGEWLSVIGNVIGHRKYLAATFFAVENQLIVIN